MENLVHLEHQGRVREIIGFSPKGDSLVSEVIYDEKGLVAEMIFSRSDASASTKKIRL